MKKFSKKYQLWIYSDGGYSFTEFETLEEALSAQKYSSDWYITKKVNFEVSETV